MLVITENSKTIQLGKSQICILCEAGEKIPSTFTLDNKKVYLSKKAIDIPSEYIEKGITNGSIFESNTCIISGCDQADSFKLMYVALGEVRQKCKEIWDNPQNYSDYSKGSEGSYYNFLKYLYVTFPDGGEKNLAEIAQS